MAASYTQNTYDEIVVDDDVGLLLWVWESVGGVDVGVEEDWVEDGGEVGV